MTNENELFGPEEIKQMERTIGHSIPRPYSQALAEDLHMMPDSAKRKGEGKRLMEMAKQVHSGER